MNISNLGTLRAAITADTKEVVKGIGKAKTSIKGFGEGVPKWIKPVSTAFLAAGTVVTGALGKMIFDTAKYGDEMDKMSLRTGLAVETLSKYSYAAKITGTDIGVLENGFRFLSRTMDDVSRGVGEGKETFEKLGIEVIGADGHLRSVVEVLKDSAESINKLGSETEKTAAVTDLFGGRMGTKLLPLLREGRSGIEKLTNEAERLGLVMSTEAARASAEFNDRMTELKKTLKMTSFDLGQTLLPTLESVVVKTRDAVAWFSKLSDTQQKMVGWGTATAGGLALVTGGAGLLLTQLPKIASGFALISSSIPHIAATAAAFTSLGWAATKSYDAYVKWRDGVITLEEDMAGWRKATAKQAEAWEMLHSAMREATKQGFDEASLRIGELNIDTDKLNKLLGTNVDVTRNAAELMEILSKSMQHTDKRVSSLRKSTEDSTESTDKVVKSTRDWSGAISALFDPMGTFVKGLALLNVEMQDLHKYDLDFLATTPKIKQTTEERTAAILTAAKALREKGIPGRPKWESKLTPEEKKAVADWEAAEAARIQKIEDDAAWEEDLAERMAQVREDNQIKDIENINRIKELQHKSNEEVLLGIKETKKKIIEVEDLHWQEMANITGKGINAITDSYYGMTDVLSDLPGVQKITHDTWLSQLDDWVTKSVRLINDLTSAWNSIAAIIGQVGKWIGGDGGGGGALVSAVKTAGGLGGTGKALAGAGGAAGGVGLFGKIGGGIKAGAGAIAKGAGAIGAGAKAAGAAALPFLPLAAAGGIAYKAFGPMLETLTGWDLPWTGTGGDKGTPRWEEAGFAKQEDWLAAKRSKQMAEQAEAFAVATSAYEKLTATRDTDSQSVARYANDIAALNALQLSGNEYARAQIEWLEKTGRGFENLSGNLYRASDAQDVFLKKLGRTTGVLTNITGAAFDLSDELAGHSLTTAFSKTAREADNASKSFTGAQTALSKMTSAGKGAGEALGNIKSFGQYYDVVKGGMSWGGATDQQRAAIALQEEAVRIDLESDKADLLYKQARARNKQLEHKLERETYEADIAYSLARARRARVQAEAEALELEIMREKREMDLLARQQGAEQSREANELLGRIAENTEVRATIDRNQIGQALWDLIAPIARSGGYI